MHGCGEGFGERVRSLLKNPTGQAHSYLHNFGGLVFSSGFHEHQAQGRAVGKAVADLGSFADESGVAVGGRGGRLAESDSGVCGHSGGLAVLQQRAGHVGGTRGAVAGVRARAGGIVVGSVRAGGPRLVEAQLSGARVSAGHGRVVERHRHGLRSHGLAGDRWRSRGTAGAGRVAPQDQRRISQHAPGGSAARRASGTDPADDGSQPRLAARPADRACHRPRSRFGRSLAAVDWRRAHAADSRRRARRALRRAAGEAVGHSEGTARHRPVPRRRTGSVPRPQSTAARGRDHRRAGSSRPHDDRQKTGLGAGAAAHDAADPDAGRRRTRDTAGRMVSAEQRPRRVGGCGAPGPLLLLALADRNRLQAAPEPRPATRSEDKGG